MIRSLNYKLGTRGYYINKGENVLQQQFIMIKCRNTRTGQTVKAQDLTGWKWPLHQEPLARLSGEKLAERLYVRTGDHWTVILERYIPRVKPDWHRPGQPR